MRAVTTLSRDRKALVLLVAMLAACLALMAAYFFTSRTWNVAATILDDRAGQMDDYTVMAFSGVVPAEATEPAAASSSMPSATAAPENSSPEGLFPNDASSANPPSASTPSENESLGDAGVFVSDVREDYEVNGAVVLTLDLEHLESYGNPLIMEGNGRSIGVFSLERAISEKRLDDILEDLAESGAQTVVCLTKRPAYLPVLDGVDVVILSEDDPDFSGNGQIVNDTFIVSSPQKGSVGCVLVTASNVASARIFAPDESSSQE